MLRKTKNNLKIEYETILADQNANDVIEKLVFKHKTNFDVYQLPLKYSGNLGVLEIYPVVPNNLLIKLEGPMFILEEVFKIINNKTFDKN